MTFSWTGMMTAISSATSTRSSQVTWEVDLTPAGSVALSDTQSASGSVARTGRWVVLVPMLTVGNAVSAVDAWVAASRSVLLYASWMRVATSAREMSAIYGFLS